MDNINSDISDLEQSLLVVEDEQEVQGQEIAELQLKTDGKFVKLSIQRVV